MQAKRGQREVIVSLWMAWARKLAQGKETLTDMQIDPCIHPMNRAPQFQGETTRMQEKSALDEGLVWERAAHSCVRDGEEGGAAETVGEAEYQEHRCDLELVRYR